MGSSPAGVAKADSGVAEVEEAPSKGEGGRRRPVGMEETGAERRGGGEGGGSAGAGWRRQLGYSAREKRENPQEWGERKPLPQNGGRDAAPTGHTTVRDFPSF
jgi:hypothetical protein